MLEVEMTSPNSNLFSDPGCVTLAKGWKRSMTNPGANGLSGIPFIAATMMRNGVFPSMTTAFFLSSLFWKACKRD